MTSHPLYFVGLAALLAACDSAPTQPAESAINNPSFVVQTNERFFVKDIAFSDCGKEDIAITGFFHDVFAVTSDGAGGFHVVLHIDFNAKGTSPTTGAQYVSQSGVEATFNAPATTLGHEHTRIDFFTLIGQGTAPNEVLSVLFHITVDANGNVTSFVDSFRVKC